MILIKSEAGRAFAEEIGKDLDKAKSIPLTEGDEIDFLMISSMFEYDQKFRDYIKNSTHFYSKEATKKFIKGIVLEAFEDVGLKEKVLEAFRKVKDAFEREQRRGGDESGENKI